MSALRSHKSLRNFVTSSLVLGVIATTIVDSPASAIEPQIGLPTAALSSPITADDPLYAEPDPGVLPEFSEPGIPQSRAQSSRAASQCQYGTWAANDKDEADAKRMMAGWARVGHYGTFRLKKNPNWRHTNALDYSGNGHMHSLDWALPLLRHGLRAGKQKMVKRFYKIVLDWIKDNPPNNPRQWKAYGQIESGFRMITLTCALAGPVPTKKKRKKIVKSMKLQATVAQKRWVNYNNVSFLQAAGIFAVGCALGQKKTLKKGKKLMGKNSKKMIAKDGSVREGSLLYARNTYLWTGQEIARMRACGKAPGPKLRRSERIADFLAQGARPDRRYEALGDGGTKKVKKAETPAGSLLRYVATKGADGSRPQSLYRTYSSGFIFGHSGFGQERKYAKETYYSVRTGPGPASEYHAHYDAAALTVASRGDQLLFDTGPYRYIKNSKATYIRSRSAHNNVNIDGLSAGGPRPTVTAAASSVAGDFTSIVDGAYANTHLQRTIWYDRIGDFFIVMDDVGPASPATFYANWNLGRYRTVVIDGQSAATEGTGANVSIINVASPVTLSSAAGSKDPWRGWNSTEYGELVASPTLRAAAASPTTRLVTVIVPRSAGVAADTVSATGDLTATGAVVTTVVNGVEYSRSISTTGVTSIDVEPELP